MLQFSEREKERGRGRNQAPDQVQVKSPSRFQLPSIPSPPLLSQENVNQSLTRFMISEDKIATGSDPLNEAARICTNR